MGKSVFADNGFVRLNWHVANLADQVAGAVNLGGFDIGVIRQEITTSLDNHRHFFQRTVTSPFTDTVDGTFNLPRTGLNSADAVRYGQT